MTYKALFFPRIQRRATYSVQNEYLGYREEIRTDCQGRCVYCDQHENELGRQHFTLDHFRPKSRFPALKDNPTNLLYACNTCNNNKGGIWIVSDGQRAFVGDRGFVDPFECDRFEYFDVLPDGLIVAVKSPAQFILDNIGVNRIPARKIREARIQKHHTQVLFMSAYDAAIAELDEYLQLPDWDDATKNDLLAQKELWEMARLQAEEKGPDFNLY